MKLDRRWITPILTASFLVVALTGVLMFFHIRGGVTGVLHEWLGWLMIAFAALHLVPNWGVFRRYLEKNWVRAVVLAALGLGLTSTLGGGKGAGPQALLQGVVSSSSHKSLRELAAFSGQEPARLVERLHQAGYPMATEESKLEELSQGHREAKFEVLGIVFSSAGRAQ